jgi:serine/threonine protein kinase
VSTRWYRSPEQLLGSRTYDEKVDIFALGCILAEMYTLRPFFPGKDSFNQLCLYCDALGVPSVDVWPEGH